MSRPLIKMAYCPFRLALVKPEGGAGVGLEPPQEARPMPQRAMSAKLRVHFSGVRRILFMKAGAVIVIQSPEFRRQNTAIQNKCFWRRRKEGGAGSHPLDEHRPLTRANEPSSTCKSAAG